MRTWHRCQDVASGGNDERSKISRTIATATATAYAADADADAADDYDLNANENGDATVNLSSSSAGIFVDLDGEDKIKIELHSSLLPDYDDDCDTFEIENAEESMPTSIHAAAAEKYGVAAVLANRDVKQPLTRVASKFWRDHLHDEENFGTSTNVRFPNRNVAKTPLMESLLLNSSCLEDINSEQYYRMNDSPNNTSLVGEGRQQRRSAICAVYLRDFEQSRPCSLPPNIDGITSVQLVVHKIRFSILWQLCIYVAVCYLFISSYFEGHGTGAPAPPSPMALLVLTLIVDIIFGFDMLMKRIYSGHDHDGGVGAGGRISGILSDQHNTNLRKARNRWWNIPMVLLLLVLSCETTMKVWVNQLHPNDSGFELCIWSGVFKPIVFFYVSSKAQDAISALSQVASIVFRVIIMEIFIILCFAAIACHLYATFDSFADLSNSFKSLFELSTTAVTPSLWIPVYNEEKSSVLFFVPFIIICVFYLHSLVLSVVFQTFMQSMGTIRDRASADREQALKLAFLALQPICETEGLSENAVQISHIRVVLRKLRPHYNSMKIDALVQIVDPSNVGTLDFSVFRSNVPKALHASLRSARQGIQNSLMLKSLSWFVAIINLCYVLILSSALQSVWWEDIVLPAGTMIVSLCIFEMSLRFCLCYFSQMPTTTLNGFLDGLAIVAGAVSLYGLFLYPTDHHRGRQCLLLGRAIDMIRVMRLSELFCAILFRTRQVLPALVGPLALVFSSLHVFTYIGMLLWGGAVTVGKETDLIHPFYDLNNFNDYLSGLLTMFNVFVVNDWNAIANVYLYADRCSSPYIVYSFFIGANLVGVSIMMNVLTAFFVGAFVTKVESNRHGQPVSGTSNIRLQMSHENTTSINRPLVERVDSHGGTSSEFRVFRRLGYGDVMQAVTGDNDAISIAKKAHDVLKIFERLNPAICSDQQIAHLITCQESQDYFGDTYFLAMADQFINEAEIHIIISEMLSELIEFPSTRSQEKNRSSCCLERVFHPLINCSDEKLTISASLIHQNPHVGLFVARIT